MGSAYASTQPTEYNTYQSSAYNVVYSYIILVFEFFLKVVPHRKFTKIPPSSFIAKNKDELKRKGVTHVVNCAQGTKFNQINTDEEYFVGTEIKFLGLQATDTAKFPMNQYFHPASEFIEEALSNKGKTKSE